MKKKSKRKATVIHETRDLDWYMKFFKPVCSKCNEPMSAHAYRKKSKFKDEVIYASCLNKICVHYHFERRFSADGVEEQEERKVRDEMVGVSADIFDWVSLHSDSNLGVT